MSRILDALEDTGRNADRKLYTILTGKEIGKKMLMENGEIWLKSRNAKFFDIHQKELEEAPDTGCFEAAGERVYVEKIGRRPKLVVCGGGYVAVAVIRMAVMTGMEVTVLEDRPIFADHARAAGADRVICDSYEQGLQKILADTDTYYVIVTRGHRYDQICVERISHMPHAYIGMMGSRRRVAVVRKEAVGHGADPEVIAMLHAPIGLDIHAETPEEIAVSIMAEIIAEKGKKNVGAGFPEEILQAVKAQENAVLKKVLATIVSRRGSAPRAVGTKMLILQDGRIVGTIGGGCLEAKVIARARELMAQPDTEAVLFEADLTADAAEEDGMVCGGVLEVFLEEL